MKQATPTPHPAVAEGFVLVPVELTGEMARAWRAAGQQATSTNSSRYRALIAAAPKAALAELLETRLPCDIAVGHMTIKKGCTLQTLVHRMETMNAAVQALTKTKLPADPGWLKTINQIAAENSTFNGSGSGSGAVRAAHQQGEYLPIESAPKDGSLIRVLVEFEDYPLNDDNLPQWTVGFNNLGNTQVDEWQFVGWSWQSDRFCEGTGTPVGWLPMLDAARGVAPALGPLSNDKLYLLRRLSANQEHYSRSEFAQKMGEIISGTTPAQNPQEAEDGARFRGMWHAANDADDRFDDAFFEGDTEPKTLAEFRARVDHALAACAQHKGGA